MSANEKTAEKSKAPVVDADDDLDELDDVLGKFSPATQQKVASSSTGRPRTNTRVDRPAVSTPGRGKEPTEGENEDALTEEFTKELAKGMESLMRELGGADRSAEGSGSHKGETVDEATERALKAAWEAMLVEGMDGKADVEGEQLGDQGVRAGKAPEGDFQSKIRETMDRLRQTESNLKNNADNQGSDPNLDSMESILGALKDLGLGEGEGDNEKELAGLLEYMMDSMMSKDVLHEPLKELAEKFPSYLSNPPEPIPDADRKRYESQLACARKIIAIYDDPSYDEQNQQTASKIVDLMSDMQSYGTPPEAVMGPMPPGFNSAGCSIM